jgi:hypothetical protein
VQPLLKGNTNTFGGKAASPVSHLVSLWPSASEQRRRAQHRNLFQAPAQAAAAAQPQPQRHVAVSRRIDKSHALAPALLIEAKRDELLGDKGERRGLTALTSRGGGSG